MSESVSPLQCLRGDFEGMLSQDFLPKRCVVAIAMALAAPGWAALPLRNGLRRLGVSGALTRHVARTVADTARLGLRLLYSSRVSDFDHASEFFDRLVRLARAARKPRFIAQRQFHSPLAPITGEAK